MICKLENHSVKHYNAFIGNYTIQRQLTALEFAKEALAVQSTETGQICLVKFNASTGLLRVKIKVSSLAALQHELQCC